MQTSTTTVFHTVSPVHGLKESVYYRVNIEGTRTILSACQAAHVKTFIFTSSSSVVWSDEDVGGLRTLVYAVECPIQNCQILALMYGRFFGGFCPHSDPTYSFGPFLSALLTRHRQGQGTSAQRIGHEFWGKMYA